MTNIEYSAYEAYKEFIDALVVSARERSGGHRIEKHGIISAPLIDENELPYYEFIKSLTDSQRNILINLLREERIDAFHDLLAELTWNIDCNGFGMTFHGKLMPVGIEGGIHQDFIGRLDKNDIWEWPDYESLNKN